jgi:hypothetical protein
MRREKIEGASAGALAGLMAVFMVHCAEGTPNAKGTTADDSARVLDTERVGEDESSVGAQGTYGQDHVWVDASGAVIAEELTYVDGEGFVWTLNLFSAGVAEAVQRPQDVYYDGPDCTGTAYTYLSRPPRQPLRLSGRPGFFTLPDGGANQLEVGTIRLASYRVEVAGEVQCVTTDLLSSWTMVRVDELSAHPNLQPPAVSYEAPLHRELR